MTSEPGLWRLAAGQALAHRGWDGEYALYNDLSGDTHLLDEAAVRVLLALQQAPAAESALARAAGIDADTLSALLADLEALALAEWTPC